MKKLTLSLLSLFAASAFATNALPPLLVPAALPTAPDFVGVSAPYGISLVEFARQILQDVLKAQFVFSDDFINGTDRVGFSRSSLGHAGSESLLRDVLSERGYSLIKKSSYYNIVKTKAVVLAESEKTDFIYRLKYRDLAYVSSVILPLFPNSGFSFQRAVSGVKSTSAGTSVSVSESPKTADNGTNATSQISKTDMDLFIFHDTKKEIERLVSFLKEVDTPIPRVLVRAYILEVGKGNNDASALSLVASTLNSKLSLSLNSGVNLGNSLTFNTPDFQSVFSALSTDSRFTVKTSPSLYANTGVKASLKVGSSVPTLGSIQTLQGGQTQQSVSYQDIGTLLTVTPLIADTDITLTVEQEISDAVQTTTGLNSTPTLNRRSLSTTLSMASGDWVLLGGLTSDKSTKAITRLPFFGIPLGNSTVDNNTDIVVLLQVVRQ